MLFARINRNLPERVYITVFNDEASTAWVNGDCVIWETGLTEATGAGVKCLKSPATALLIGVAGFSIGAVVAQTYGLIQIYGLHTAVKSTGAITAGASNYIVTAATAGTVKAGTIGTDDAANLGAVAITAAGNVVGMMIRLM